MPTGFTDSLSPVAKFIEWMQPHRVLDIGVGNGRMGFLAREYAAQEWNTRYTPGARTIDGIEGYEPYIGELQRIVYDEIVIGEALAILGLLGRQGRHYDLAVAADIIEHFDVEDGRRLVDLAAAVADVTVVATPNWDLEQKSTENAFENHRSYWPVAALRDVGACMVERHELSTIAYYGDSALIAAFRTATARPGIGWRVLRAVKRARHLKAMRLEGRSRWRASRP